MAVLEDYLPMRRPATLRSFGGKYVDSLADSRISPPRCAPGIDQPITPAVTDFARAGFAHHAQHSPLAMSNETPSMAFRTPRRDVERDVEIAHDEDWSIIVSDPWMLLFRLCNFVRRPWVHSASASVIVTDPRRIGRGSERIAGLQVFGHPITSASDWRIQQPIPQRLIDKGAAISAIAGRTGFTTRRRTEYLLADADQRAEARAGSADAGPRKEASASRLDGEREV